MLEGQALVQYEVDIILDEEEVIEEILKESKLYHNYECTIWSADSKINEIIQHKCCNNNTVVQNTISNEQVQRIVDAVNKRLPKLDDLFWFDAYAIGDCIFFGGKWQRIVGKKDKKIYVILNDAIGDSENECIPTVLDVSELSEDTPLLKNERADEKDF